VPAVTTSGVLGRGTSVRSGSESQSFVAAGPEIKILSIEALLTVEANKVILTCATVRLVGISPAGSIRCTRVKPSQELPSRLNAPVSSNVVSNPGATPGSKWQPAKPTSSTTGTTIAGTRSSRSNHSAMARRAYPTSAGNSPVISVMGYYEFHSSQQYAPQIVE
jgi:hypothetical protein